MYNWRAKVEIGGIYIYSIYIVFYGTFTHGSMNNLDSDELHISHWRE